MLRMVPLPRCAGEEHSPSPVRSSIFAASRVLSAGKTAGSVTVKVEPCPNSDDTAMLPLRRRTRLRTVARPMPSPGVFCSPERRNRSKMRSKSLASMPRPLSAMA